MSFDGLIEAIIDGVLTGGVYALMAAGLSLIFGVMDIINIAQGAMVVLGAYLSYVLSVHLGIDLFVGLLITAPAMFALGVLLEWGFMRRLREGDRTSMSILVTYAFAIIIEGVLTKIFGSDYRELSAPYINDSIHILNFYLPVIYLLGFAMAAILLGGAVPAVLPHQVRPRPARVAAEPHRRRPDRHQRQPHAHDRGRDRRRR